MYIYTHHSRSLCPQAAFVLRAHQPPACFSRLHVSVDAARAPYFLHSLFFACDVACCFHLPITRAACVLRLHSYRGLTSLQPASVACMYQSMLLALHIFCTRCFSLVMWRVASIYSSLAQLVFSGCIRIEGSPASSRLHASVDADSARYFLHSLFFACDVVCFTYIPITRAACVHRLHSY